MDPITGTPIAGMVLKLASSVVLDLLKAKKLDDRLLRNLEMTLLAIDKLLDDAEEKQITDKRVKKWLEKLQEAVYDAEDLLDAINTEAMQQQQKKKSQLKRAKSKLNRSLSSSSWYLSIRKRINSSNIFKPSLTSPAEETKVKEILQRLEDIVKQKDLLGLKEGPGICEKPYKKLLTTSLVKEHTVFGRDEDKESIMNLLFSENSANGQLGVIAINGMGGIGKTTLAQLIYNDGRVDQQFDFKAWVYLSEEFDVIKVTKTILEAFTSSTVGTNNADILQVELKKNMADKKFFLVLDDVWNEDRDQWEKLKRPLLYGVKGSRILVTTRSERVARIMQTVPTYDLKELSEKDCRRLFAKYAFEGGESQAHPIFKEVGEKIAKKCNGLPLAAKALGGLLRCKTTVEEWNKVMESNMWDLKDAECNILPVLRVSYHHLPSHLKRCFAFASVFPKNYQFAKDELILLWAAQSLLPETDQEGENMMDIGGEYFNELLSRSFLKRSAANSSLFVMHNLMHDLATFVSGQSCRCMDPENIQVITKKTRHMSYFKMSIKQLETLPTTNTLRTFIQLERGKMSNSIGSRVRYFYAEMISYDLLTRFKLLRVLSFREYEIDELPDTIGNLIHLRYFDLSRTAIKRLPDSICDLYNLQTLILTSCASLIQLPTSTWKLVNLLYLEVTGCSNLREMPGNLGKLKNLARLSQYRVGKDNSGASIKELGPLSNLHGELSISDLQNVVSPADAANAKLKGKKYLEKLELSWNSNQIGSREEYEVLENLQPHKRLKKLTIQYYGKTKFPNWIGNLMYDNMVFLNLQYCKCDSMPMLGQLPSLKKLCITGFDGLQTLNSEFYGNTSPETKPFRSLEILEISNMEQWKEWLHCNGETFPILQELCIKNCPILCGDLPAHLPSLVTLTIGDCPQLAAPLPDAPALFYLRLESSNEMLLHHLPEQLMSLEVHGYKDLISLPERFSKIRNLQYLELMTCPSLTLLPRGMFSSTLKSVIIVECPKLELRMDEEYASLERLTIEDNFYLRSILLQNFPKIVHLVIRKCWNLESCSLLLVTCGESPFLTHLDITDCPQFRGFPDENLFFHNLRYFSFQRNFVAMELPKRMRFFWSLETFILHDCPNIVSLPKGGLPSSLRSLEISHCDQFVAKLLDWGLHELNFLQVLEFSNNVRGVKSFPAVGLLPKSLNKLTIRSFIDLETLEYKGFQQLTTLSELTIEWCPNLRCIPPGGLPASLTYLSIRECPLLEPRLRRNGGEDWDEISRIPCIFINGKEVLS